MTTASILIEKAKAGYPIVYLQSDESSRSMGDIRAAAKELDRRVYEWFDGSDLTLEHEKSDKKTEHLPDTDQPVFMVKAIETLPPKSVIVIRLFHHYLSESIIQAQLLKTVPNLKTNKKMVIVLTPVLRIPHELEKEIALVEVLPPTQDELRQVLMGIIKTSKLKEPPTEEIDALTNAALGLNTNEAENAFSLAIVRAKLSGKDFWDPRIVLEEKCSTLKKTGILEYISTEEVGMQVVGGFKAYKTWLYKRLKAFTEDARKFGLPNPKGVLFVGPPGAGKSLAAKATAEALKLPLLKLDIGKIYGSLVGQSEANVRLAIRTAEAVSPCVLWVDELDKGLAGAVGNQNLDSGVGARVVGNLLTWMAEKKTPVFVVATCNNVNALPPELLRKGRFDELFSVDLPGPEEIKEILWIHLNKRGRGELINKIDLESIVDDLKGFSGSEIEAVIVEAMHTAYADGKDLNAFDLCEAISHTIPLSITMSSKIEAIREWCKGRTRDAHRDSVILSVGGSPGRVLDA